MIQLLKRFRCWLFGHKRNIDDLGGVIYEVCDISASASRNPKRSGGRAKRGLALRLGRRIGLQQK